MRRQHVQSPGAEETWYSKVKMYAKPQRCLCEETVEWEGADHTIPIFTGSLGFKRVSDLPKGSIYIDIKQQFRELALGFLTLNTAFPLKGVRYLAEV